MVPMLNKLTDVVTVFDKIFGFMQKNHHFKNLCSLVAEELHENHKILYHRQENTYSLRTSNWEKAFDILSQRLKKSLFITLDKVYYKIETFTSDPNNNLNREEIIGAVQYCEKELQKLSRLKK